jgi:hypothetical protein
MYPLPDTSELDSCTIVSPESKVFIGHKLKVLSTPTFDVIM